MAQQVTITSGEAVAIYNAMEFVRENTEGEMGPEAEDREHQLKRLKTFCKKCDIIKDIC